MADISVEVSIKGSEDAKAKIGELGKSIGDLADKINEATTSDKEWEQIQQRLKQAGAELRAEHDKQTQAAQLLIERKNAAIDATVRQMDAEEAAKNQASSMAGVLEHLAGKYLSLTAIIGSFVAGYHTVIESQKEAAINEIRIDAILEATGATVGRTKTQLLAFAQSLEQTTALHWQSIQHGMSIMLMFGNVQGEVFERAIKLAADYSRLLGVDMAQAARIVGRAVEDPVLGMMNLSRMLGQLDPQQKAHIKNLEDTGHLYEAQIALIDIFNNKMGGLAEKMGGSWVTAGDRFTNAFKNLAEAIGHATDAGKRWADNADFFTQIMNNMASYVKNADLIRLINLQNTDQSTVNYGQRILESEKDWGERRLSLLQQMADRGRAIQAMIAKDSEGDAATQAAAKEKAYQSSQDRLLTLMTKSVGDQGKLVELQKQIDQAYKTLKDPQTRGDVSDAAAGHIAALEKEYRKLSDSIADAALSQNDHTATVKAGLQAELEVTKAESAQWIKILDEQYKQGLLSYSEYFAQKGDARKKELGAEIDFELQIWQQQLNRLNQPQSPKSKEASLVAVLTTEGKIGKLNAAFGGIDPATQASMAEADSSYQALFAKWENMAGKGGIDAAQTFANNFYSIHKKEIDRLMATDDNSSLVGKVFDVGQAQARATEINKQVERITTNELAAEKAISIEVQTGLKTEFEGRQAIVSKRLEEIDAIKAEIQALIDSGSKNQIILDLIDKLQKKVVEVQAGISSMNMTWEAGFRKGIDAYISNVQDVGKSAAAMTTGFLKSTEDMLTQLFAHGKVDGASFLKSIEEGIARFLAQQVISEFLNLFRPPKEGGSAYGGFFELLKKGFSDVWGFITSLFSGIGNVITSALGLGTPFGGGGVAGGVGSAVGSAAGSVAGSVLTGGGGGPVGNLVVSVLQKAGLLDAAPGSFIPAGQLTAASGVELTTAFGGATDLGFGGATDLGFSEGGAAFVDTLGATGTEAFGLAEGAGLAEALAAIPGWGWVAAGALALFGGDIFGGGGPKPQEFGIINGHISQNNYLQGFDDMWGEADRMLFGSGVYTPGVNTGYGGVASDPAKTLAGYLAKIEGSRVKPFPADWFADWSARAISRTTSPPYEGPGYDFGGGGGGGFATGTDMIVSRPTIFQAGEAGLERVTVSPLGGAARFGLGGAGNVVFQGINIIDEYSWRRFRQRVAG